MLAMCELIAGTMAHFRIGVLLAVTPLCIRIDLSLNKFHRINFIKATIIYVSTIGRAVGFVAVSTYDGPPWATRSISRGARNVRAPFIFLSCEKSSTMAF